MAALALAAGAAAAEFPAGSWDQGAAAPRSLESIRAGFKVLGDRAAAESAGRRRLASLDRPQDVLSQTPACFVVDAKTFMPFTMEGALKALQPCLQALGQRCSAEIRAQQGMVAVNQGKNPAVGIQLRVRAGEPAGDRALADLQSAVRDARQGSLLGFPAAVLAADPQARLAQAPAAPYGVPSWIDGRSLRMDARQTRLGPDGYLRVVLFDKDDGEVELLVPPAGAAGGQTTVDFIRADDSEAGPFTIDSIEARDPGALGRLLSGVEVPAGLDAPTAAAVRELLGRLRR